MTTVSDTGHSAEENEQIRHIKRAYWTQEGIAEEYQYFAYKPEPITRLKNVVEIGFVGRHAVGPRVLDAGAGTCRFTLPLRQSGLDAVALDISAEMLRGGIDGAARRGQVVPGLVGDIERLPFNDATFDSVVSITVLRHFPQWPLIFEEYVRVLRPGGRLIFDMASNDQREFMVTHGFTENPDAPVFDPVSFDTGLSMDGLKKLSREHGLSIVTTTPNDFFNENRLLDALLGDVKEAFDKWLMELLAKPEAIEYCDLLALRFMPALSNAVASSWLIVLEKKPSSNPYEPAYRRARDTILTGSPEQNVNAILETCLGIRYNSCMRIAQAGLESPDARALFDFLRAELLPRFPLEACTWESGR
jgi:SAM-dependent methyltransferase